MESADTDFVVFGSLARGEWTSSSDVDWTLLVDGQANPQHRVAEQTYRRSLSDEFRSPGPEGAFGSIAFSHELIHHIGGPSDTNRNTTQRVLLLLESTAVRPSAATETAAEGARERVIRGILDRYICDDSSFAPGRSSAEVARKPPRFLLNDIVRFWRTMCVDFACKEWEQSGKKWALRNVKLRMSRKLIFVSGLLACYRCTLGNAREPMEELLDHVRTPPLEALAGVLEENPANDAARKIFGAYDEFLSILNNDRARETLDTIAPKDAYSDGVFLHAREVSHTFQEGLTSLFLDLKTPVGRFTRDYGVF